MSLNASFRAVENREFRTLLLMLNPSLEIPKRSKIRLMIDDQFSEVHRELKNDLRGENKISLALDTWTSPNKLSFIAITAYVVNARWEYQEHLLGFEHISGAHDGENLAAITMRVLQSFEIEHRLFAITADNASNNNTLRRQLARRLQREYQLPWDASRHTVPCLAHVIQLVVREIIEYLNIDAPNDTEVGSWDDQQLHGSNRSSRLDNTIHKVRLSGVTFEGNIY